MSKKDEPGRQAGKELNRCTTLLQFNDRRILLTLLEQFCFCLTKMRTTFLRTVFLEILLLPSIKTSWPQDSNCSLNTASCSRHDNATIEMDTLIPLQRSVSWNCTIRSIQVYLSCKGFDKGNETLKKIKTTGMCCEFYTRNANRTLTRGSASCLLRRFGQFPTWYCEWQRAYLLILKPLKVQVHWQALYSDCRTPLNRINPRNCSDKDSLQPSNVSKQELLASTSWPQDSNCSLNTANCSRHDNATIEMDTLIPLQRSVSWNCTIRSIQVYLSCKGFDKANETLKKIKTTGMCCEFYTRNANRTLTRGSASCLLRRFGQIRTWYCEWQRAYLRISHPLKVQVHWQALYSYCRTPMNRTNPRNCSAVVNSTMLTPTDAHPTTENVSSKSISLQLLEGIKHVNQFNCTVSSIQTVLSQLEEIIKPLLREILKSNLYQNISLKISGIFDIYVQVTGDLNKTVQVPDRLDKHMRGSLSLPPGLIDIKHGKIAILMTVFNFEGHCNDTEGLKLDEPKSNGPSLLRSPLISVLALSEEGDIESFRGHAELKFRTKNAGPSLTECKFLNGTSGSWSSKGMEFGENNLSDWTVCLTNHLTSFAVFISHEKDPFQLSVKEQLALDIVTKIGCGIGLACLTACIIILLCVRNLSAIRFRIHLNLCIALVVALSLFIAGIEATGVKGFCTAVAILLHFFFTASFSWMCLEAIHLFTKIVSVFHAPDIRMRYYLLVGWGLPAVIVIISVSVDVKGYTTPEVCWLDLEGGFIWAFIAPVILIVLINIAVLIAVIIVRVSLKGNLLTPNEDKKFVAGLKTVIVLFPLLGLSWAFGLVAMVTKSRAFLYPFAVLSPLQGVFIFLLQIIGNSEVRGSLKAARERYSTNSSLRNEHKTRESKMIRVGNNRNPSEKKLLSTKLASSAYRNKKKKDIFV
ncbi:adhesion G protein-coupled receptor L3-like isoform X2 [Montipora foliosa]|uniref:adhesion G protein-coupled receptor L3-like isoform X2 n=1 Tax=Montipora foliosa TaxID=591990 RepID=UPI0035F19C08